MNKTAKSKKRALRIKLSLVYTVMVLSVLALVTVLYMVVQGYRYNRYQGQLEQGGLVQFNSLPGGADVLLDGQKLASRTQSRLTISAGGHRVAMQKTGYLPWEKQVTVRPGQVLWLSYPRLVPQTIRTDTVLNFAGTVAGSVSREYKRMALIEDATKPVITVVTMDTDSPKKTAVTLPETAYTAAAEHTFTLVGWAYDEKYVLVKHTYPTGSEWISVDTASASVAKNITTTLGVSAADVQYTKDDANTLYVLTTAGEVRKAAIDQKTLSGPLLQHVSNFSLYGNVVAYATTQDAATGKRSLGYLTPGAAAPRTVASFTEAAGAQLRLVINKYYGATYLVAVRDATATIYAGDLAGSDSTNPAAFSVYAVLNLAGSPAQYSGFSPEDHRFVYLQNSAGMAVYDLDQKLSSTFSFAMPVQQPAQWVDQFHLAAATASGFTMYDYDGTNSHVLLPGLAHNEAALTPNGKYLYALQHINGATALVRLTLITE